MSVAKGFLRAGLIFLFCNHPYALSIFSNFSLFLSEANKEPEKQNEASLEKTDKENVLHKNPDNKPSYKYVEVVRKRDERAKLNGYDCRECQQVHKVANSQTAEELPSVRRYFGRSKFLRLLVVLLVAFLGLRTSP